MSIELYKTYFRTWNIPGRLAILSCLVSFSATIYANVFTVNVTSDGNDSNQLRGAIAAAMAAGPGPHTINVAAGSYDISLGEISFGNSAVTISIIGAGPNLTILNMNATNRDRFFLINPTGHTTNVNITIQGIQFNGGHLTSDNFDGGAILCGGPSNNMVFSNCIFSNNTIDITKGQRGGALAMEGGGSLIIDSCNFSNNSCPTGNGGAFFYFLLINESGSLSISNSVFNNNSVTATNSLGGAIALLIQPGNSSTSSSISIHSNTFTNNHALAIGGAGGAIFVSNSFSAGNTAFFHFNRFAGNSATNSSTSAVDMANSTGNVDINNNWWACNDDPTTPTACNKAAITITGSGTLIADTWLQLTATAATSTICDGNFGNTNIITAGFLKNSASTAISPDSLAAFTGVPISFTATLGSISGAQTTIQPIGTATANYTSNGTTGTGTVNAVVDNVPSNDALAKASFTVNPAPTINIQPSPTSACPGHPVSFSVSASGSNLSFNWFKGPTSLSDGTNASGSIYSGSNSSAFNIFNPSVSDNSTAYKAIVTGNGCSTSSSNTQLVIAPLVIPGSSTSGAESINTNDNTINDGSCNRIALVAPAGAAPINGNTSASVTIDAGQPSFNGHPYVKRHYDIVPASNASTSTANITLYFLQSEFDSYNAAMAGTDNDLPTDPFDVQGRNNLHVTQYHGIGSAPGNYTGWTGAGPATVLINPGGANVNWNSSKNWWEVTFPVTGFSGFFVTGQIANPLPVTLQHISAEQKDGGIFVKWQVAREVNFSRYDIETSTDGRNFTNVGTVPATNTTSYNFLHNDPADGVNYYRLKMIDIDRLFSYSPIVSCNFLSNDNTVRLLSNPIKQTIQLRIASVENTTAQLFLTDDGGRLQLQKSISLNKGSNAVSVQVPEGLANGIYFLRINTLNFAKTLKVLKSE